jgi:hypothetical protein
LFYLDFLLGLGDGGGLFRLAALEEQFANLFRCLQIN